MKKCMYILLVLATAILLCAGAFAEGIDVGSYVSFGAYPQTAEGNDETPIEWLVLECDGDKALLLSRCGLDAQPYNAEYTEVTWENCTLHAWLNDDFLNRAFTAEEQAAILLTDVDNSDAQGYSGWATTGGNDTQDRIFLLSYAEANRYFDIIYGDDDNLQSRVTPTVYAAAQGAWTSDSSKTADGEAAGWWWLRSPGHDQLSAASVAGDGSLNRRNVHMADICVRPALWVKLEAVI